MTLVAPRVLAPTSEHTTTIATTKKKQQLQLTCPGYHILSLHRTLSGSGYFMRNMFIKAENKEIYTVQSNATSINKLALETENANFPVRPSTHTG